MRLHDQLAPGTPVARPKRILLLDAHPMMRAGLHSVISAQPDLEVCGETDDALAAVALTFQYVPHLLVM
jgi:DNA-binding NarL/FixJ family response regulator